MSTSGNGQVLPWPTESLVEKQQLRQRLQTILAVFVAIDSGEMLSAMPECEIARAQHCAALSLLAVAKRELYSVIDEIAS